MRQLRARNARIRAAAADENAVSLVVRIDGHDSMWTGRVTVRDLGGGESERAVTGENCAEVAASLAFISAIAVEHPAPAATEPPASGGGAKEQPGTDAGAPPASPSSVADAGASTPEGKELPPSEPKPSANAREGAEEGATTGQRGWAIAVGADGEIVSGAAPAPFFAIPVFVELASTRTGPYLPFLRVAFERAGNTGSQASAARADLTRTIGVLDVGALGWSSGAFRVTGAVRLEAGALASSGVGVQPALSTTRPWARVGPVARARWMTVGPFFLEFEALAGFTLVRDRFFVDAGSTVFEAPPVGWNAALGLGAVVW
jgi:hypothetical protein